MPLLVAYSTRFLAQPGKFTVAYSTTLPGIAPAGNYGVKFAGTGGDGKALFCVDAAFQIVKPSHVEAEQISAEDVAAAFAAARGEPLAVEVQ